MQFIGKRMMPFDFYIKVVEKRGFSMKKKLQNERKLKKKVICLHSIGKGMTTFDFYMKFVEKRGFFHGKTLQVFNDFFFHFSSFVDAAEVRFRQQQSFFFIIFLFFFHFSSFLDAFEVHGTFFFIITIYFHINEWINETICLHVFFLKNSLYYVKFDAQLNRTVHFPMKCHSIFA